MKIALVVHDLDDHGGHSRYTQVLANGFSSDHEVTVFANRCVRPADSRWKSVHVRASRGSALASVQTFPLGMRAHRSTLSTYDIQHSQGFCGGQPNVVTAHICVSAYPESLKSISIKNRVSINLMAAAEKRFYRNYRGTVIAISNKIASELREFYKVKGRIVVIPHGVDTRLFNGVQRERNRGAMRRELNLLGGQTMALYVGDLTKSHVHLKSLAHAVPHVQFLIVTGSKKYHWQMPNVRFHTPTNSIERYYAAADAFVFPTTYDAFGMVVLEAMAMGLPVFSSNQAGACELIQNGIDGFVTPLDEWVESTSVWLCKTDTLQQVGQAAEKSAGRYGWASILEKVEEMYMETIADCRAGLSVQHSLTAGGLDMPHANITDE